MGHFIVLCCLIVQKPLYDLASLRGIAKKVECFRSGKSLPFHDTPGSHG